MGISEKRNVFVNRFLSAGILIVLLFYTNFNGYCQTIDVEVPKIRWVCINDSGWVELRWEPSTTPGVKYYTVRYGIITSPTNPKLSWTAVDNVQIPATGDLYHIFNPDGLLVNPNKQPVPFAVKAHIDDPNTSEVDQKPWDSTILLKVNFDSCLSEVTLNWNKYNYNMWPNGTKEYKIFISTDEGANYTLLQAMNSNQDSLVVQNLLSYKNYYFYVAAISGNIAGDSATSNRVMVNTKMARIPDYIQADYATCVGDNAKLSFTIDPQSELSRFNLLRSVSFSGPFDSLIQLASTNNQVIYTDKIDYAAGPYFYKLEAINYCNQEIKSSVNVASTIVLANIGVPLMPALAWNAYSTWLGGVEHYTIERKLGDGDYSFLTNVAGLTYTDTEIQTLQGTGAGAKVCYKLTALESNNAFGINATSQSNEVCIELPVNIRFDYDAFMPASETDNNSFGPTIDFLPDDFIFEILDRSGNVVYESTDPQNANWDGKIKDSFAPAGAYMYVLQYHIGDGKSHVIRGGLVVVYP